MGGAYAWGRTRTKLPLDERDRERKTRRRLPLEDWRVLLKQHPEGYVEWEEWLAIQERLARNAPGQGGLCCKGWPPAAAAGGSCQCVTRARCSTAARPVRTAREAASSWGASCTTTIKFSSGDN